MFMGASVDDIHEDLGLESIKREYCMTIYFSILLML